MKITFDETVQADTWLTRELLNSLSHEAIQSGTEKREYEVMISVNGILLEPKLLQELLANTVKYIDQEAAILSSKMLNSTMEPVRHKMQELEEIIEQAKDKVRQQFNIDKEE